MTGVRNVRYCEVIPTYRQRLTLRSEVYNTLGLNDCPADSWATLEADALKAELEALNVILNGPRYWVLDEISAVGGVTAEEKPTTTFGELEMKLQAIVETRITGNLVGKEVYSPNTVERDTRYVFYGGELIYVLTSPDDTVYVMQSYAQIVDPNLTINDLETLGERLNLPEGWEYRPIQLEEDFVLTSNGQTTVITDDFSNTYQYSELPLPL